MRLVPGANPCICDSRASGARGAGRPTSGATARGAPLVDTLRTILRAVAIVDGLVCLYALIQACALTVQERRRTVAVLRAAGAGPKAVRRLLAGAAIAIVIPAGALGVALERLVLGPAMSNLAAGYASLQLAAGGLEIGGRARLACWSRRRFAVRVGRPAGVARVRRRGIGRRREPPRHPA